MNLHASSLFINCIGAITSIIVHWSASIIMIKLNMKFSFWARRYFKIQWAESVKYVFYFMIQLMVM